MTIIEAMEDPALFAEMFSAKSWNAWKSILRGIFALPMSEADVRLFEEVSGGRPPPKAPLPEVYILAGRRSGKSRIASLLACYKSVFFDYRKFTVPGESVLCGVCSHTRDDSAVILAYAKSFFDVPMLRNEVADNLASEIRLVNGVTVATTTAKRTTGRGRSVPFWILEESSFFKSEGPGKDEEILTAILPSMSTIPDSMLMSISTPYASVGINYQAWRESYGREDESVLCLVAPTRLLNPTVSQKFIDRLVRRDRIAQTTEWILDPSQPFRRDISNFLSVDVVESAVEPGVTRRPPQENVTYSAFYDASGGRNDAACLGIGHQQENDRFVLDLLHASTGAHDPAEFIKECAGICGEYRVGDLIGDRYAASFVSGAWAKENIVYENSELSKSELYKEALPVLTSGGAVLLDDEILTKELVALERRTGPSGKDIIAHPPRGHDDRANVVCGLISAMKQGGRGIREMQWIG